MKPERLEEKVTHLRDRAYTHDQLALMYEELGKWGTASGEREQAARLRAEASEVERWAGPADQLALTSLLAP